MNDIKEYKGNIGYLFYKKMYNELSEKGQVKNDFWKELNKLRKEKDNKEKVKKEIKDILNPTRKPNEDFFVVKTNEIKNYKVKNSEIIELGNSSLKLKTTYPGLLLGSGYSHDTGLEGDFKLGFYFDYTTGLPIIPGSSIKGVLRSVFKHEDYIKDLLINKENLDIKKLEQEIFDYRDIFYDAEIETEDKKIFGEDYLCPHGENPLKNPTPLKFLKVLPGITFKFQFELKNGLITAEEKNELFRKILLDIGVGAKTNVSYGQFDRKASDEEKEKEKKLKEEADKKKQEEAAKKKQEEIKKLSQPDQDIYYLNLEEFRDENKLKGILDRLKDYNSEDKKRVAFSLKEKYKSLGKWDGKQSKKQTEKKNLIESILKEE
ncbi:MAG: type III-B CRISPR module RAMP protein Cmr6 [Fusobacterium sp. JB019]|nr:type III-B CRISPR module RAMP protein Cmr6 [Fusobacterium sp. JB019]